MNTPQSNLSHPPLDTPKYSGNQGISSIFSNSLLPDSGNTPISQNLKGLRAIPSLLQHVNQGREDDNGTRPSFLQLQGESNQYQGLNMVSQLTAFSGSKIPQAPGSFRLSASTGFSNPNPMLDIAPKNIGTNSNVASSPSNIAIPSVGDIPIPILQNIVCTVNLGCKLSLKDVALKSRNAEYNPKRFAAVIMRIREPKTTALIFSSGKMVCTGSKSEEDAVKASRKYARIIQKLGFEVRFKDFKIQNMVGSCDVKFAIRLEGLTLVHDGYSTYEPELFPGLIYRMHKPKIVLLIFVSGKVVLTGAKVREQIYEAFNKIYPLLKSFQKTATN